jgi:hypothetical protein
MASSPGGGKGLAEASLTRSIPESPFELDGGPPTSSVVAPLKLSAEWVAVGLQHDRRRPKRSRVWRDLSNGEGVAR